MVEVLVKADDEGYYKKGFSVIAQVAPFNWGGEERPPKFVLVSIVDATSVSQVSKLFEEITEQVVSELQFEIKEGEPPPPIRTETKVISPCKYKFTEAFVDSALSNGGNIEIALADLDDNLVEV